MFSKTLVFLVLASSALSGFAAKPVAVAKEDCPTVSTRTVTVTGRAEQTGAALVATGGSKGAAASKSAAAKAAAAKAAAAKAAAAKAAAAKGTSTNNASAAKGKTGTAAKGGAAASSAAAAKAAAASKAAAAAKGKTGTAAKGGAAASSAAAAKAAAASKAAAAKKGKGGAALADAGNAGAAANLQTQLTLDPGQIATGFLQDGQAVAEPGQVKSLTSGNNFINFCATTNLPISNGKQITSGSCNPAIIGMIASVDNMPSAKFQFPGNFATIKSNSPFTISMAVKNLETGNFVNAQQNYFSAPQQLNAQGQIIGHSHVVIEAINGLGQTTPTDPTKFAFFKGLNNAAVGGILTADVVTGLPAGTYKMSSINSAANHQPAIVPVAQHGSLDDAVYFTVADNGAAIPAANAPKAAAKRSFIAKEQY